MLGVDFASLANPSCRNGEIYRGIVNRTGGTDVDNGRGMRTATLIITGLLLAACSERQMPTESVRGIGKLAARLLADGANDWFTVEVPGVHIHLRRGSAAETDRRAIAESVSAVRRELLAMLGGTESQDLDPTAHLFFVNARDDTQRLTGRPVAGFIQQDEPTGVFIYTPGYRHTSLLRHELTHLYTFQRWGARARVRG